MSKKYEGQDPIALAYQAERDLNSHQAKHGVSTTDSSMASHLSPLSLFSTSSLTPTSPLATESGVDTSVTDKFPGSTIKVGSAASGAGDNREIPVDEGGDLISKAGEKGGSGQ